MKPTRHATVAVFASLCVGLAAAGCGSDDGGGGASGDAAKLVERAFSKTVESGELSVEVKADLSGPSGLGDGRFGLTFSGPFKSGGEDRLPLLDWDVDFNGGGLKLAGGLVMSEENAFLKVQGQSYELGEDVYARLVPKSADRQGQSLTIGGLGLDPETWLKDAKVEDGEEIGGDATRKVTGSVDVRKVVEDLVDVLGSPAVRDGLKRQGRDAPAATKPTDKELDEVEDAITRADVEMNVDRDDVLRRFFAAVDINVKGSGDEEDTKGTVSLSYRLNKVGGDPTIRAPANPKPLAELLGGLGGLLGGGLLGGPDGGLPVKPK